MLVGQRAEPPATAHERVLDRTDTPWYPTMRLFRQPTSNDWAGVFREVRRQLEAQLARPAGAEAGAGAA